MTELTLVAAHLTGRMRQNEWDPAGNMISRSATPNTRVSIASVIVSTRGRMAGLRFASSPLCAKLRVGRILVAGSALAGLRRTRGMDDGKTAKVNEEEQRCSLP
jgi:hypothetical protein